MTRATTRPRALEMLRDLLSRREVLFLLVGGTNTVLGLAVFALLYWLWGDTLHYLGALVLAYAVGIAVGFTLQRRFVFRVRGNVLLDLVRYTGVQAVALALNSAVLPVLVEAAGLPVLPAQVVSLVVVVVATYFAHLLFSFRRPEPERP